MQALTLGSPPALDLIRIGFDVPLVIASEGTDDPGLDPALESVRRVYAGLHSFLNMSLMEARAPNSG